MNSSLSGNTNQIPNWVFYEAEKVVNGTENTIQLNPSSSIISFAQQISPYFLTPGGTGHTLRCKAKVSESGKVASLTVYTANGSFGSTSLVTSTDWEEITINIQNSNYLKPIIYVEADNSQGNNWTAHFKEFSINATGNEWLAIPNPNPPFQLNEKEWTFGTGLNSDDWIVSTNLNSQAENLSISESGNLKITAYGNQAPANKQKSATLVATREYFPSGRFDFWIKVGPVLDSAGEVVPNVSPIGAAFACFPFHFNHFVDGEPHWYDEPSSIRNSEIDWEMPADNPPGNTDPNPPFCPIISWENVRCNSWGGQRGGESGNIEMHNAYPNSINMADGAFHQLTIIWNNGEEKGNSTRNKGYIEWYIDTGDESSGKSASTTLGRKYMGI